MAREYKMYVNGEWIDAFDGSVYDDLNPYTGEVFARVPAGKRADASRAVDAAAAPSRLVPFAAGGAPGPVPEGGRCARKEAAEIVDDPCRGDGLHLRLRHVPDHVYAGIAARGGESGPRGDGEIIPADLPGAFYMAIRQPVGVSRGSDRGTRL